MNEEMIELRELIRIIWKGKIVLIVSIIVAMLIAALLSVFVLDKKYESKATVQITSNTAAEGIVKQYIDSEFTNQVFEERIKSQTFINQYFTNEVSSSDLNVNVNPTTSMISLSYSSGNPKKSSDVLTILIDEQKKAMADSLQNQFTLLADSYTKESKKLSDEIRDLIKIYNTTVKSNNLPQILILQSMVENQLIVDLTQEQQASLVNIDGEIQNELMQLQARIDSKSTEYSKVLDQYQSVLTNIESFRPDPLIKTIIEPNVPEGPSSPNTLLNIAIGLIIGAMVGLGIVFTRKYWKESSSEKK